MSVYIMWHCGILQMHAKVYFVPGEDAPAKSFHDVNDLRWSGVVERIADNPNRVFGQFFIARSYQFCEPVDDAGSNEDLSSAGST